MNVTVVAAVNDERVLDRNLMRSPDLVNEPNCQLLFKRGFRSAALAYNAALDEAEHDLVVFLHQDVYLPAGWLDGLRRSVEWLESSRPAWGVLGSFGSSRTAVGGLGQVYTTGKGLHGNRLAAPSPAETLDEIVLVLRKSSHLRFDEGLPHFHLYGSDICLQSRQRGLGTYAIPAFCVHNTNQLLTLPPEFYACYRYLKHKWSRELPIHTSSMTISRFDSELHKRRFEDALQRLRSHPRKPQLRADDPTELFAALGTGPAP